MAGPRRDENGRFVRDPSKVSTDQGNFKEVGLDEARASFTVPDSGLISPDDALMELGLDPEHWEVKDIRRRQTEGADGEVRHAISLYAKRRAVPLGDLVDVSEINATLDAWVAGLPEAWPRARRKARGNGREGFVLALADWQIGGASKTRGTSDTMDRVLNSFEGTAEQVENLRAAGLMLPELYLPGLGDLVEQCLGYYSDQTFTIDMNLRDQIRTAWRLILAGVLRLAPLFERVVLCPVGGNHGEASRVGGKQPTDKGDNLDLLVFEAVADAIAGRPNMSHVELQLPENPLWNVVDMAGVDVGITHGHLFNGGANAAAKAERWWRGQAFGRTPMAAARILLSGHYHSLGYAEWAEEGRSWFQTPAMDNGSQWFTDMSGISSPPGMLSFVVGESFGLRGWDHSRVI